jgi:hypothetical protein
MNKNDLHEDLIKGFSALPQDRKVIAMFKLYINRLGILLSIFVIVIVSWILYLLAKHPEALDLKISHFFGDWNFIQILSLVIPSILVVLIAGFYLIRFISTILSFFVSDSTLLNFTWDISTAFLYLLIIYIVDYLKKNFGDMPDIATACMIAGEFGVLASLFLRVFRVYTGFFNQILSLTVVMNFLALFKRGVTQWNWNRDILSLNERY